LKRIKIRARIYLTEKEPAALLNISRKTGKNYSVLIRQAVDPFIGMFKEEDRHKLLSQARGLWAERQELPDFNNLRREMDCRNGA
jgi:hypothetical protein